MPYRTTKITCTSVYIFYTFGGLWRYHFIINVKYLCNKNRICDATTTPIICLDLVLRVCCLCWTLTAQKCMYTLATLPFNVTTLTQTHVICQNIYVNLNQTSTSTLEFIMDKSPVFCGRQGNRRINSKRKSTSSRRIYLPQFSNDIVRYT